MSQHPLGRRAKKSTGGRKPPKFIIAEGKLMYSFGQGRRIRRLKDDLRVGTGERKKSTYAKTYARGGMDSDVGRRLLDAGGVDGYLYPRRVHRKHSTDDQRRPPPASFHSAGRHLIPLRFRQVAVQVYRRGPGGIPVRRSLHGDRSEDHQSYCGFSQPSCARLRVEPPRRGKSVATPKSPLLGRMVRQAGLE